MPIAMAIGVAMLPGTAAAQASVGNGGLELCPGGVGGVGSSWGPLSSAVGIMGCTSPDGAADGMSFSLNNSAADNGAWGFTSENITARITGFDDGRLELKGMGGIKMLNTVSMTGNKITDLAAGDVSSASSDAVSGQQLYQYSRYFQANSVSSDPSTDAQATGPNSVASGPLSRALSSNSSAYGANAIALAPNSVALGAGSQATRADTVSVGYLSADGGTQYTRQITNVTAGAAGTDAVNVNQLNAAIASVNGGNPIVGADNPVTYDSSLSNLITLKGTRGTKITNLTDGDISNAASMDAVNGSQLFHTNQNVANVANAVAEVSSNLANVTNVVDGIVADGMAGSPLVVRYDSSAKDKLTLGGVGKTTAVQLTNVAAGDISSASSTDAVNGGQLYETNQNLAGLAANVSGLGDAIYNRGIKYFHANSSLADSSADGANSVAIGGAAVASAANSVALGSNSVADRADAVSVGSAGSERQIINVAQGTADTDAVNLKQLNTAIDNASIGTGPGLANAVVYDSSVHDKLTLGGAATEPQVLVTNLAAGQVASGSTDAVNGDQLYKSASGLTSALGAGASVSTDGTITAPDYLISGTVYHNIGDALSALNTAAGDLVGAAKYVKVVSTAPAAAATGAESVAIGGGAMATKTQTLAIGTGATASFDNSTAIGVNAITDASYTVSFGSKGGEMRLTHVANGVDPTDVATMAQLNALQSQLTSPGPSGVKSMMQSPSAVLSYIAVSNYTTQGSATSVTEDMNAMAIGPVAAATAADALAVGAGAAAGSADTTAIGSGAGALSVNSTAIGASATVGALSANSVSIGYNTRASSTNALALGAYASSTSSGSVAIGYDSFVSQAATNGLALGVNATTSAANSVAIGSGAIADRANVVSVGNSTRQSQIINVAAGTSGTDAVNVSQLSGVAAAIGGGATVNPDGTIRNPSFTVGGRTYADVGSALEATANESVQYDTSDHTKVTLGGTGASVPAVTLSNVANGVGDSDAVNIGQLKQLGMNVDASGNMTNSFVAYDDTTLGAITLKGTGGTTIANVAAAKKGDEAVNLQQLQSAGLNVDSSGNVTNSFVAYDDTTLGAITLKGAGGTTIANVAAATKDDEAVNLQQLKSAGLNVDSSGNVTNSFVAYDDTTLGAITLKGANGTTIGNVAAATKGDEAVNLQQLQSAGLNVDSSGNVTNSFVAYDDTTLGAITLKGAGGTTIGNLAAATKDDEAVNLQQLKSAGLNVDSSGNVTNSFVAYDDTTLGAITLKGANGTTIGNVAAATKGDEAVNLQQLQSAGLNVDSSGNVTNSFVAYDDTTLGAITLKGAGGTTIGNVAAATKGDEAVNLQQLQSAGLNVDSSGNVTNSFVAYDDTTLGAITLKGAGGTTIANVAAATKDDEAVNLQQLKNAGLNVDSSGNVTNSFVAYDDTTLGAITLKGANGTTIGNVAAATKGDEAVNLQQLQNAGLNVDSSGNVTNSFVAYDDTTLGAVTLKGADGTTIANVKAGDLTATSMQAVNGSQLFQTNANVANIASDLANVAGNVTNIVNNIVVDGGGIKYFHANSTLADSSATGTDAVAVGGAASATAANSVALGTNSVADRANTVSVGAAGTERQIVNVANATNSTDAVNLSQLQALGANVDGNGTVTNTFISYDDPAKTKVTFGGVGSTVPVLLTHLAEGQVAADSSDAVNGAQLYKTAQSIKDALGGGASVLPDGTLSRPSYVITGSSYGDVGSAVSAVDDQLGQINTNYSTNLKYVKVVSDAATAQASGPESIAIGGNAIATKPSSLAIGAGATAAYANSTALGVNAITDASYTVSFGSKGAEMRLTHVADGINATDVATVGQLGALQAQLLTNAVSTSDVKSMMQSSAAVLSYIAVSSNVVVGANTTASEDLNAMAIGPVASATGESALAVGAGSIAGRSGSTAVGSTAVVASVNATAIGDGASVGALSDNAVSIGYNARASAVDATALGTSASATSTGSVAIGYGSFASQAATGGMAMGLNATVSAVNGVAIGYGAIADRANAVSVGNSTRQSQIINVAAGTQNTDAVNLGQMNTAIDDALSGSGGGGSAEAVLYDTASHDKLTLNKGGAAVTVSNVAAGVANNDAVNVSQLKATGANIDSSGNVSNAFVAYDDSSKTTVTLGGTNSTVPVVLANVGVGAVTSNSKQAINGSQLYDAMSSAADALGGGSTVNSNGQISKPVYAVGNSTYTGVDAAINALNTAIKTGGNPDGVAYDTSAHDMLTLGGVGSTTPVTIANVAAATADDEAVNLKQLKDAGLNVDSSGNVTNAFVAYDNADKLTLTFNPNGAPTQLKNVAAGTDATDAVNLSQMQDYVASNGGGGGGTANGVAYDDASKSKVTLGGVGSTTPVTLTNLADGSNASDAVTYGQFSSLQSLVNNLSGGDAGGNTYVNIGSPDSGNGTAAVASGSDAIAIGNGAAATGKEAIAIGKNAVTAGDSSVALGSGATAPNTNSVALGAGSTTDRDNSVSVGSVGAERQITNVAAGTQGTDAVNMNQLNSAMGNMNNSINNVDRNAAKGIASASALNIVTPYLPGRTTLNAGIANYRGYQAVGLGVSRWNEKGTINYNLGVSTSGGNSTIVRAGIGIVLGN